ncbi:unnamed protein product [Microthlaspi erraticum]|uniref:Retrotransposon gag domain-containing protein n=1 Tax=Microthlaspi erraticum TaxID=1685480 RepID=A0A6D2J377_9BRAS|nr:unnamed protein product [Microthlaspi erraticum]
MGKIDDLADVLHGTVAALTDRVDKMQGAVGISSRRLITSSPIVWMRWIETYLVSWNRCRGSKEIGIRSPSHRNRTTSPTADDREVRDSVPPDPGESLGYRKCSSVLENRNNMLKRIELPAFAGTDPYLWISQAERFFRLGKYNDEDRLDLLSITLQGPALHWFNREMQREPFSDWCQFKRRMIA